MNYPGDIRNDEVAGAVDSMLRSPNHRVSRTEVMFYAFGPNGGRIFMVFEHGISIPKIDEELRVQTRDGSNQFFTIKVIQVARRFYGRPQPTPYGESLIIGGYPLGTTRGPIPDPDWEDFDRMVSEFDLGRDPNLPDFPKPKPKP
jgi:hypothetical protein